MNSSGYNYNNNNPSGNGRGDVMSWVVVVICLIAFWPLGLILLLKKIGESSSGRSAYNQYGKYQQRPTYQQNARPRYGPYGQYYRPQQQQQQHTAGGHGSPGQHAAPGSAPSAPVQPAATVNPATGQQSGVYPAQGAGRQTYYNAPAASASVTKQPYYRQQTGQNTTPGAADAKKTKKTDGKQLPAKNLAVALTVLAVVLGIMGVIFLSSGLSAIAVAGMGAGNLGAAIFGGFSLLGAVISAVMRGITLRRVSRFSKYAAVIGSRDIVTVGEISRTVGEPSKKTRKALQAMIDSGYFGESAYIDSGLDSLVLSREAAEKARIKTETTGAPEGEKTENQGNQYVAIINELHMLCSQTSDPAICGKIERIEELTAKIFRIVEEKPEKLPQLRRFMNYYMPTTLKLLHSYQTLERQGINGENITSAKQDIERILDTLAVGYEQQLDDLFMSDKLDISAEVNVLENLMERDGLKGDGGIMKTAGGN
jgi:hypothetical protein